MTYFSRDYIDFLTELAFNNEKSWFDKNRARYEQSAREPFKAFTEQVISGIQQFDPTIGDLQPKDVMFRINRDIRFSNDKTPYNTWLSAAVVPGGKRYSDSRPGYYFRFAVDKVSIGGGLFHPDKTTLTRVRRKILKDPMSLSSIINSKPFKQAWGQLQGEEHKVLPKEFKAAVEQEPLIRRKSFMYWAEHPEQEVLRPDLISYMLKMYKQGSRLNRYLS